MVIIDGGSSTDYDDYYDGLLLIRRSDRVSFSASDACPSMMLSALIQIMC